jgi:valyl-tRNA synthetase
MKESLDKAYEPHSIEEKWLERWLKSDLFNPNFDPSKKPFSMVIPPPNVTGSLHIGHALNNTIQDVLARYKRMDGFDVLWVPGTDHAGIATQNVVERELAKEGLSRHDLGREKFLERVWQWKEKYGNTIIKQLQRLGASCSWKYLRFTMDEGLSKAVREVFCRLYEEGLIYRGDYIINWCPRCETALADLEVEFEPKPGKLWYLVYPLANDTGEIVVATTRPETMLGDTAVAVNPEDKRYKHLIGKMVRLPLIGRLIPIIADKAVDPEFGTGAVKVTPAHDFADFEIAKRHNLPFVKVIDEKGAMTAEAGPYQGLDRFTARERVVEDLKKEGLLLKEEEYEVVLGHCYRCGTVIEPLLSKQWFVKTKPLAQPAISAVEYEFIKFYPENWKNLYFDWMKNIRDWCISRQIWWGHRIPIWYCEDCGETIASREDEVLNCPKCGGTRLKRDEDVLDTWFSSALWPFSTMGWPEKTELLKRFYPTSVLVTSFDIIFFWVARMIMMGIHFMGAIPFERVYIHALVRDEKGQKMSKSKGNVIDPLDMIAKYGADALRFTLIALAAQGRDIKLSTSRIEGFRHFLNKLWNASRFVLMNLEDFEGTHPLFNFDTLPPFSKWILVELDKAVATVRQKLEEFEFDQAAMSAYHFLWDAFCDWYLEISKLYLKDPSLRKETQGVLYYVLSEVLKLLHPFIPFITEELWSKLPGNDGKFLLSQSYPTPKNLSLSDDDEKLVKTMIELVQAIRYIKSEYNLSAQRDLPCYFRSSDKKLLEGLTREPIHQEIIKFLARIDEIKFLTDKQKKKGEVSVILTNGEVYLDLTGHIDILKERERLQKEKQKILGKLAQIEKKLSNPEFLTKAPEEVVAKEKASYVDLKDRLAKIERFLEDL